MTLSLVIQLVRKICKESFKAVHESINIACTQFLNKLTYIKASFFIVTAV